MKSAWRTSPSLARRLRTVVAAGARKVPLLGRLPPSVFSVEVDISILKLDPNPASIDASTNSASVTLVFSISNPSNRERIVRIGANTDEDPLNAPSRGAQTIHVAAYGTVVGTIDLDWHTPGQHTVELDARATTDQVVVRLLQDSDGTWHEVEEHVLGDLITVTGTVFIYENEGQRAKPSVADISPNQPNGAKGDHVSTAGVIGAMAGDEDLLYAVSGTAGVWRSVQSGQWEQLQGSPQFAFCIAIDPDGRGHIAVGERDGDANPYVSYCGLWESSDAGNTWDYTYDPYPDTGAQHIYAVAFSHRSNTLFIGTEIGVGRKPAGNPLDPPPVEFPASAVGAAVTAFAISETKVWARTSDTLLVSSDDGLTWTRTKMPPTVHLKSVGEVTVALNTAIASGYDHISLAAFDDMAFVVFEALDANGHAVVPNCTMLIYDTTVDSANQWKAQMLDDGDGRGIGGRRFVKSFILDCPDLLPNIGERRQLFYSSAQGVAQATGLASDRTVLWSEFVRTYGNGKPNAPIHSDVWDFHVGFGYCPPHHITAWLAGDGGVYEARRPDSGIGTRPNPEFNGIISAMEWVTRNDGLHTHNAHAVSVVQGSVGDATLLAYPTSDNDAWWRKSDGEWRSETVLGDVNLTKGDSRNTSKALLYRGVLRDQSALTDFGDDRQPSLFEIGQAAIQLEFIQTATELLAYPQLDAVMLAQLPLHDSQGQVLPSPQPSDGMFGGAGSGTSWILMRNSHFADHPDGPASRYQDWTLEANMSGLPQDAQPVRFWVSGGHSNPVYYLCAAALADYAQETTFYKWTHGRNGWAWKPLISGVLPPVWSPDEHILLYPGTYGPAFVDPYDPLRLFVITFDATHRSGIIQSSVNGGTSFRYEDALTALVTDSGRYPLGVLDIDPNFETVGSRAHTLAMCNPV